MKYALITGASSGIGASIARKFAEAGINLILCARRMDRLEELKKEIEKSSSVIIILVELDVTQRDKVQTVLKTILSTIPQLDYLVNNAGLSKGLVGIDQGKLEDWDVMIDTNVKGLLYVTKASIPYLLLSSYAQIVNIGSIAGHEVYLNGNVYCATKAAVDALTKAMRVDLLSKKIKVSTVDPGLVETEFSTVRFDGDSERAKKLYTGVDPLTPDDVADTVLWIVQRPKHVQVAQVVLLASAQSSALNVIRE